MSIFSCLDFIEDIPVIGDIDKALSSAIDDFGDFVTGSDSSSSSSYSHNDDDDCETIIRHRPRRIVVIEEPDTIVVNHRSPSSSDDDYNQMINYLRDLWFQTSRPEQV